MEFEVKLTRTKYAKLLVVTLFRQRTVFIVAGLFILILIVSLVSKLPLYLSLVYLVGVTAAYGMSILNAVRTPRNRRYFVPKIFDFSSKGVTITTANVPQQMKWSDFTDIKKVSEFYILFVTKHTFIVIPQRSVPNTEITAFESLLYKNITRQRNKALRK